ncbi:putative Ig domain-containing protein [Microbacterium aquimaris]|uniref:Ig domain-containing protein n=1 Tax=Microbacterium aquimaris TaxID=459816 RepID=A0ABU5N2L8_9MICO|nr:putative Ig domain-containing protein [Microbacterium aquimaris]MDZ8160315.1 putative Ig domain-containing protein [Microbacterium aquimaris]
MPARVRTSPWRRLTAAALAAGVLAATMTAVTPPQPATAAEGPGLNMLVKSDANTADDRNTISVRPHPGEPSTGFVQIQFDDGLCLTEDWMARPHKELFSEAVNWEIEDSISQTCSESTWQRFSIQPVTESPVDTAAGAFWIVSASTGRCYFSDRNGLHGSGNLHTTYPSTTHKPAKRGFVTCGEPFVRASAADGESYVMYAGTYSQRFSIKNDERYANGAYRHWSYLLAYAARAGASNCAGDGNCRVRPEGTESWLLPTDPTVTTSGSIDTRLAGCGEAIGDGSNVLFFNNSAQPVTHRATSQISSTVQETHSYSASVGGEVETTIGGKDAFVNVAIKGSFSYTGTTVEAQSNGAQSSVDKTVTVPPFHHLMVTWSESVYTLDARWRLGVTPGQSGWETATQSSIPVRVDGQPAQQSTVVISSTKKTCLAGPAATSTSDPEIAMSIEQCDAAGTPELDAAIVGRTYVACPGQWEIPEATADGASTDPVFAYQWYYVDAAGEQHPIPNATRRSFTLQEESFLPSHTFLGVSVAEVGDMHRLEAQPVVAPRTVKLSAPATASASRTIAETSLASAPVDVVPTFAGESVWLPAGAEAERSLVADADLVGSLADGDGMALTVDGDVPPGMDISPDGRLAGTPTVPGEYTVVLTDTVGDPASATFVITVSDESVPELAADRFDVAVDEALGQVLDIHNREDEVLQIVSGTLPPGVEFDAASATLTGAPVVPGTSVFAVLDTADPFASPHEVTIVAAIAPTAFDVRPLPVAQVGVGYPDGISLVAGAPPAGAAIGVDGETADLGGLMIDAESGRIHGTPTTAGRYTFAVRDLTTSDSPAAEFTLVVSPAEATDGGAADGDGGAVGGGATEDDDAAGSGTSSDGAGTLASTGADDALYASALAVALLLTAAGSVVYVAARRAHRRER